MEKINSTNIKSETNIDGEKEAQLLKLKTEMKAGQILMEGAAKQIQKIKERLEQEHSAPERTREDNKRDTADISQTRSLSQSDRTDQNSAWRLEMEAELWDAFVAWSPVMNGNLSGQLHELSEMYLALLESVLKYTMGEAQTQQMARLDAMLSEKLDLLMNKDFKDLVSLLKDTGQTEALMGLKASVYRLSAGQSLSQKEVKNLFDNNLPNPAASRTAPKALSKTAAASQTSQSSPASRSSSSPLKEGTIYKSSGNGKIQPNQNFEAHHKSWQAEIKERKQVIHNAEKGGKQSVSTWGSKNSFTKGEMVQANRFASHLKGSGDLFKQSGITAQNGEVMGLLAAVTSIKGRVYASESGQGNALSLPLQSAIDKLIDHYVSQKAASKVYYYTLNVYERSKSPQKAVESGLQYAYEQFKEKQGSPACQNQAQYAEQAGFFQLYMKGQTSDRDFAAGARILEDNWKDFLRALGKNNDTSLTLKLEKQSPWGSLMEPEKKPAGKKADIEKILLVAAIIITVAAVIYFNLRP